MHHWGYNQDEVILEYCGYLIQYDYVLIKGENWDTSMQTGRMPGEHQDGHLQVKGRGGVINIVFKAFERNQH